jgi:hypothetical protein
VLFEAFESSRAASQPVREVPATLDGGQSVDEEPESLEVNRRLKELGYI